MNEEERVDIGVLLCQMMKRDQLTSEDRRELQRMLSEMEKGE